MDKWSHLLCGALFLSLTVTISSSHYFNYYEDENELEQTTVPPVNEKVKLTVFYESLCPDSIDFFVNQLRPAYLNLNHNIKLDLVPYGNAKQNFTEGHWNFTCQHGILECDYNKLHACTLKLVKQESKAYKFISCLMVGKNESSYLHKCAMEYKVDLTPINRCRKSSFGDNLLAKYGDRTHNFRPRIQGVPTVAFNNVYTKEDQDEALNNLPKVICRHLKQKPRICEDYL